MFGTGQWGKVNTMNDKILLEKCYFTGFFLLFPEDQIVIYLGMRSLNQKARGRGQPHK